MSKFSKHCKLHDQNGFAIITVIFVLALITLSGVMVIQTTNNELQISTNDQINKISFYAAEAGRTYARSGPKTRTVSTPFATCTTAMESALVCAIVAPDAVSVSSLRPESA